MIFRDIEWGKLAEIIKKGNKRVIIYGAGMIGRVIAPYFICKYEIAEYVECFVDADLRKQGDIISAGGYSYEIKAPEYLYRKRENRILLITNSKFSSVVKFLNDIKELDETEGFIIPMMQLRALDDINPINVEKISEKPLIPKTIHYCWFGRKEMPESLQKCIFSWKEHCPDYEIICWNEDNFDVNKYRYTKEAYQKKKYGFVTDVARLDILLEHGGIYLDTDVTLVKNLDTLLYQEGFVGVEKWGNINTGGGCGFVQGHPMVKEMLAYRNEFSFVMNDGSLNKETNGYYETVPFLRHGFRPDCSMQRIQKVAIYPPCVFSPYDYMSGRMQKKEYTYGIHHFRGGWMEEEERLICQGTRALFENAERQKETGYNGQ